MATVIQPVITANVALSRMYVALDDPDRDWNAGPMSMLKQGPIDITSEIHGAE
jgi:hypothetical protein